MQINKNVYVPSFTNDNGIEFTDTVYNLYANNKLTYGAPLDASNVYAVANQECVINRRSEISIENGILTCKKQIPVNSNVRMVAVTNTSKDKYLAIPAQYVNITNWNNSFNYVTWYNSEIFPLSFQTINNSLYNFINNNNFKYQYYACKLLIAIADANNIGYGFKRYYVDGLQTALSLTDDEFSEILDTGKVVKGRYAYIICGVTMQACVSGQSNTVATYMPQIQPFFESYGKNGTMFGTPYNHDKVFFSGLNSVQIRPDGAFFGRTSQEQNNYRAYGKFTSAFTALTDKQFLYGIDDDFEIDLNANNSGEFKGKIHYCSGAPYGYRQMYFVPVYNLSDILNYLSAMGQFFTVYESAVLSGSLTHDLMYLGHMDKNGICNGTYTQGIDNENTIQWGFESFTDSPIISPVDTTIEPIDPETIEKEFDGDIVELPSFIGVGSAVGFVTQYALTSSQLLEFGKKLWTNLDFTSDTAFIQSVGEIIQNVGETVVNSMSLIPSNLMNYVLSVRCYPINFQTFDGFLSDDNKIFIGRGLKGLEMSANVGIMSNYCIMLDGGVIDVSRLNNDFRDYQTMISLYVPYSGTVNLNPSEVVGKTLHLYHIIDLSSGTMTTVVYVNDNYVICCINGVIGADVPLTTLNAGGDINKIVGAITSYVTTGIGGAVSSVGGSLLGQDSGIVSTGKSSGFAGFGMQQTAYVKIIYKKFRPYEKYGNVSGYLSYKTKVNDVVGFVKAINVNVNIPVLSEDENRELKNIMERGFVINE